MASTRKTEARPAFETSDVSPRAIAYAAVAFFACVGLSVAFVVGLLILFHHQKTRPPLNPVETASLTPPAPRLEGFFPSDRAEIEATARQALEGYAWIDRKAGTARIPIEEAMKLLSQRGWPDDAKAGTP